MLRPYESLGMARAISRFAPARYPRGRVYDGVLENQGSIRAFVQRFRVRIEESRGGPLSLRHRQITVCDGLL